MHCAFDLNLASLSVSSLPRMFVYALLHKLCHFGGILLLLLYDNNLSTVRVIRSLLGWLYWEEGFLI